MTLLKFLTLKYNTTKKIVLKRFLKEEVLINDKTVKDLDTKLNENDLIKTNDGTFKYKDYCYLKLNKPAGFISSNIDEEYPSLLKLVPFEYYRSDLNIVGRLDQDTLGLIILTNDGDFIHQVTHPKKEIAKTYLVNHKNILKDLDISQGIAFKDYQTKPIRLEIIDDYNCLITITEGKYHEVKRIIAYLGSEVIKLTRIKIGGLTLDDLPIGGIKELTKEEIDSLK